MIILKFKDIEELKSKIGENALLIACSGCPYWNYSREDADSLAEDLDIGIFNIDGICDTEEIPFDLHDYDSFLVLSCGAGVQMISELLDREVIPAADTIGLGVKINEKIRNYCMGCSNCILDKTASLCPRTRCPKGLINGPCGGVQRGMCEIGNQPCVWALIFERLKKFKKLDDFMEPNMPKVSGE